MATNTVLIRVDTVPKDIWDKLLELAEDSESVSALTEAQEALLALAENAEALLALLEDDNEEET